MNEDKRASRNGVSEPPPSLLEKIGTHPLGAAAGAIGGALTGALVGVVAGPVGSLQGGVLLGGALGASTTVGPQVDVAEEDRYWREHYAKRPYMPADVDWDGSRHTGMARALA